MPASESWVGRTARFPRFAGPFLISNLRVPVGSQWLCSSRSWRFSLIRLDPRMWQGGPRVRAAGADGAADQLRPCGHQRPRHARPSQVVRAGPRNSIVRQNLPLMVFPVVVGGQLLQVLDRKVGSQIGDDPAAGQRTDRGGAPTLLQRCALAEDGPGAEPGQRARRNRVLEIRPQASEQHDRNHRHRTARLRRR